MRVIIAAGGGGHFSAAYATINSFPQDWEYLIVGRKYVFEGDKTFSFEYQMSEKNGFPFESLTTGRLQRKFTRHTLASLLKVPVGFYQAFKILKKFRPDVVVSFGGYVAVPIGIAASMLRIPVVLHEQTLRAGLTNKILSKYSGKICISWEESRQDFPEEKTVMTGNPLRKEFLQFSKEKAGVGKHGPVIYVTGGSSGSHAINVLVEGCLEDLVKKYIVIHQTGDAKEFGDFERLKKKQSGLPQEVQKKYILTKFVDPSSAADFLDQADLVVSRSGVNTVTELLYLGKPCLLIPLPFGQKNEQMGNATFVKNVGLAEVLEQNILTPESLYLSINNMMNNIGEYKKSADYAKKLIRKDAAQRIIEVISDVVARKN